MREWIEKKRERVRERTSEGGEREMEKISQNSKSRMIQEEGEKERKMERREVSV